VIGEAGLRHDDAEHTEHVVGARCDPKSVHLVSADFCDANLRNAVLRDANLSRAVIVNADLSGADCRGSDFQGARIEDSRLFGADLRDANLMNAVIEGTQYDAAIQWPDGFSPPPSTPGGSVLVEGTTLTEWLSLRRTNQADRDR